MTTIVLTRSDLAAIARSNLGGDLRGIRELRFKIDADGCIVDVNALATKRRDYVGPGLSRAADVALARFDRKGQQAQVIQFKPSSNAHVAA